MHHHAGRRRTLLAMAAGAAALVQPARAQAQPLELGIVPHLSARALMGLYRPLREALQRQLQRDVQLSTAASWSTFHQRTLAHDYHCVVTAANLARLIQVDAGWSPLARFTPDMRALLIAARQRPLAQLADQRGGVLALANPQSLVALRGLQWLAEQGLQRGRDFQVMAAPQDDSVGALVSRGDCAAAILSGGEFMAIPEATRQLLVTVRHMTDVPGFVVAASPRLPGADVAALAQAWLAMPATNEGRAFFAASGFAGFEPPSAAALAALDPLLPETRRLFAAAP
jgi:phosphonate transport system substrate-binding protein